jgi:hypothetical protein
MDGIHDAYRPAGRSLARYPGSPQTVEVNVQVPWRSVGDGGLWSRLRGTGGSGRGENVRLLATQLTYRQIAGQPSVSVHAVMAQVAPAYRKLEVSYRKLEVSFRTQAIERARSLGLLPG